MLIFVVPIVVICFLPYLLTSRSWFGLDFRTTGQIGDTIGGIMGPFIAIAAAILTFIAFWVQYKANEQQRQDIRLERFETKYYELLHLHKENLKEIRINDQYIGREAFLGLYNELRFCFYTVKFHVDQFPAGTTAIDLGFQLNDNKAILEIAYLLFFVGLGDKSERLWFEQMDKHCERLFSKSLRDFAITQQSIPRGTPHTYQFRNRDVYEYLSDFMPFVGHIAHLGHYYRHLYQSVKYVDNNQELDEDTKKNHLKTLRAQLSSYEQILLYYNTLSRFGRPWLDPAHPYLVKYRMIKNIPLPLADFGVRPEEQFHEEVERTRDSADKFFEWHEV